MLVPVSQGDNKYLLSVLLAKIFNLREGLKKNVKFGRLAEPPLTPPLPPNLGPVIRSIFFYCLIQIYTLQNIKQLYEYL